MTHAPLEKRKTSTPARRALAQFGLCAVFALGHASTAQAQDMTAQPLISEPYTVVDARAAMDAIMARDDMAEAEDRRRFSDFEGPMDEFVTSQPVFQDVSWDYGPCTDLVSLIPPPMDGWAIRSDFGRVENPISDARAEIFYEYYDHGIAPSEQGFSDPSNMITIRVTESADSAEYMSMMLDNEAMRSAMLASGPYGYPVMKMAPGSTQLGPYGIQITGNSPERVQMYLTQMIGCAIDNGLILEGVDPASLTSTP